MRLSKYLTEKYWGRVGKEEVFVNPTKSDIKDLKKSKSYDVRFLVDPKKKKVYAWPGQMIHVEVVGDIVGNYSIRPEDWVDYITGTAEIVGSKLVMTASDEIEYRLHSVRRNPRSRMVINKWKWIWETDLNWVFQYVDMKSWLKDSKKVFENIKDYLEAWGFE